MLDHRNFSEGFGHSLKILVKCEPMELQRMSNDKEKVHRTIAHVRNIAVVTFLEVCVGMFADVILNGTIGDRRPATSYDIVFDSF